MKKNKLFFILFVIIVIFFFICFLFGKQNFGFLFGAAGDTIKFKVPSKNISRIYTVSGTGPAFTGISYTDTGGTEIIPLSWSADYGYLIPGGWYVDYTLASKSSITGQYWYINSIPNFSSTDSYDPFEGFLIPAQFNTGVGVYTYIPANKSSAYLLVLTPAYYIYDYSYINAQGAKITAITNANGTHPLVSNSTPNTFVIDPSPVRGEKDITIYKTNTTLPRVGVNNSTITTIPTMVAIYNGPDPIRGQPLTSQTPYTFDITKGTINVKITKPPTAVQTFTVNINNTTTNPLNYTQTININIPGTGSYAVPYSDIYLVSVTVLIDTTDNNIATAGYSDSNISNVVLKSKSYLYINDTPKIVSNYLYDRYNSPSINSLNTKTSSGLLNSLISQY